MTDEWGLMEGLTTQKPWYNAFLKRLAETANVSAACRFAKVSRVLVYSERAAFPDFAKAWEDAIEIAVEILELEARRRAEKGYLDPVFQSGIRVGSIRRYSDTLIMFLLKSHRPGIYADRKQLSGPGGGPIALTGALATYDMDADEAATIFDQLATIGAFETAPDDAASDEIRPFSPDA